MRDCAIVEQGTITAPSSHSKEHGRAGAHPSSGLDGEVVKDHRIGEHMEMLYCIEHGQMVEARPMEFCVAGHEHFSTAVYDGAVVQELDFCCFDQGYATCPPPELFFTGGQIVRPTPEEIAELDQNVTELLTEW